MSDNETPSQKALRRLKRDARDGDVLPVGYQDETGNTVTWTGTRVAPYVHVINPASDPGKVEIVSPLPLPVDVVSPLPLPVDVVSPSPLTVDGLGPDDNVGVILRPTSSAQWAYSFVYQTAAAASLVVKASAGRVYQAYVFNPSGGTLTFQLFNRTSAPGGGTVPTVTPIAVPADAALFLDYGPTGLYFDTGITIGSSSTVATFTSSAGLHMTVVYF